MLENFFKTIKENDQNFNKEYQYQEEIVERKERSVLLASGKSSLGVRKDTNGDK
jgi:hypothetical protein